MRPTLIATLLLNWMALAAMVLFVGGSALSSLNGNTVLGFQFGALFAAVALLTSLTVVEALKAKDAREQRAAQAMLREYAALMARQSALLAQSGKLRRRRWGAV